MSRGKTGSLTELPEGMRVHPPPTPPIKGGEKEREKKSEDRGTNER
jgi:hypothetical protein